LIIVIDVYTAIKPKKCPSLILDMVKWLYLLDTNIPHSTTQLFDDL